MDDGIPVLKPSKVMRLTKAGKLPASIDGGQVLCEKCRKWGGGMTESPTFWENGSYVYCKSCKAMTLARPRFPGCEGFTGGFEIDLTGERKTYSVVMDKESTESPKKGLYTVWVREDASRSYTIEAESPDEAKRIVESSSSEDLPKPNAVNIRNCGITKIIDQETGAEFDPDLLD